MLPCKPFVTPFLAIALWLVVTAPAPSAQDARTAQHPAGMQQPEQPLLAADELVTSFFRPEHVRSHELYDLARQFHGRDIYVIERGGLLASPVRNLQRLGESILIYDDPSNTQRVLDWFALIDQPRDDAASTRQPFVTLEWQPGYISLDTAQTALAPFRRTIVFEEAPRPTQQRAGVSHSNWNVTALDDQGVLILRDTADQVDAMQQVLENLDKPEPQLMVTVMVLRGTHDSGSEGVPADLVRDLSRLVPYEHFETVDMGMVRSSARNRSIEVLMANRNMLDIRPEAFDPKAGKLTGNCRFQSSEGFSFETRTSISTGEYTVLGASGSVPLFAVLRIVPLD